MDLHLKVIHNDFKIIKYLQLCLYAIRDSHPAHEYQGGGGGSQKMLRSS